jgi:hypothetical protein
MYQRNPLKRIGMRRSQNYWRGDAILKGFAPPVGTKAPSISWFQSWKLTHWKGRCQVISATAGKIEKFSRHLCTNTMPADVSCRHSTVAFTKKTCQGLNATSVKRRAKNVFLMVIRCLLAFQFICFKSMSSIHLRGMLFS